jgi:hypothetical protein
VHARVGVLIGFVSAGRTHVFSQTIFLLKNWHQRNGNRSRKASSSESVTPLNKIGQTIVINS